MSYRCMADRRLLSWGLVSLQLPPACGFVFGERNITKMDEFIKDVQDVCSARTGAVA